MYDPTRSFGFLQHLQHRHVLLPTRAPLPSGSSEHFFQWMQCWLQRLFLRSAQESSCFLPGSSFLKNVLAAKNGEVANLPTEFNGNSNHHHTQKKNTVETTHQVSTQGFKAVLQIFKSSLCMSFPTLESAV